MLFRSFALNGAANFLIEEGIPVENQVILDPRPENVELLSMKVSRYYLASQCDVELFHCLFHANKLNRVSLWHPKIDGITDKIAGYKQDREILLIGGGVTVGLSAMCLAYALGYRKLHLFGYDSSHRDDKGHAYDQDLNRDDPLCKVKVGGETFISSLTMAKQAEQFPIVCDNLLDLGCVVTVDGDGLLPFMVRENAKKVMAKAQSEAEKYQFMWNDEAYRLYSPGEMIAERFVAFANIKQNDTVIDFGCGTGRGAKKIHELTGCKMILIDFTDNCLDKEINDSYLNPNFLFLITDLTSTIPVSGTHGFCTDVLEHIPTHQVETVIKNIMNCVEKAFFQISLVEDSMGQRIGEKLHLTVKPFAWWEATFKYLGYQAIIMSEDYGESAVFYIQK